MLSLKVKEGMIMSDALNHYLCGQETLNRLLDMNIVFDINQKVYDLGTQGPDIFFYYNVLLKNENSINYGSIIHQNKVDDFFYSAISKILSMDEGNERTLILSYLLGLISHHALDVATHPFIFYRSGKYLKSDPSTKDLKYNHKKYEVFLDIAFYNHRYSKKACNFPISSIFSISLFDAKIIESFYKDLIKDVFSIDIKNHSVVKSIKKAKMLTSMLSDPTGMKKLVFGFIEILSGSYGKFSNAFYPMNSPNDENMLNLTGKAWHHPSDIGKTYHSSYNELFDQGVKDALDKFLLVLSLIERNAPPNLESIKTLFKNLSYETGLDCNLDNVIRYFDSVI
jgi:hypothetical protein